MNDDVDFNDPRIERLIDLADYLSSASRFDLDHVFPRSGFTKGHLEALRWAIAKLRSWPREEGDYDD